MSIPPELRQNLKGFQRFKLLLIGLGLYVFGRYNGEGTVLFDVFTILGLVVSVAGLLRAIRGYRSISPSEERKQDKKN